MFQITYYTNTIRRPDGRNYTKTSNTGVTLLYIQLYVEWLSSYGQNIFLNTIMFKLAVLYGKQNLNSIPTIRDFWAF